QACDAGEPARALQLYRGDFLAGFFVNDGSAELERWIEGERLRLRRLAARAAAEVAQRAERDGDLAAATSAARQAVAFDLDDEPALARLIELLDRSGDRAGALNAFETFRRGLLRQYDATPSPETDARIQAIRARQTPFVAAAPRPGPVTTPLIPAQPRPWGRVLSLAVGGAFTSAIVWRLVGSGARPTSVTILPLSNATLDLAPPTRSTCGNCSERPRAPMPTCSTSRAGTSWGDDPGNRSRELADCSHRPSSGIRCTRPRTPAWATRTSEWHTIG